MNLRHLTCFCLSLLLVASCKDDVTETVTYDASKDAQIYSFSVAATFYKTSDTTDVGKAIRAKDSIDAARITAARFAIDQLRDVIYNTDSLPYGTTPQKVKMTVAFNSTYGIGQFEIYVPDSAKYYVWNNSDSIDLSKMPVHFLVTAPQGFPYTKEYRLDLRIHQIDPDTIVWRQQPDFEVEGKAQKVLLHENTFYAYSTPDVPVSSAFYVSLYTADKTNPPTWTQQNLHGLPPNALLESITVMNGTFFAIDGGGSSYTSPDGIIWTKQTNAGNISAIYGVLPGTKEEDDVLLLAVKKSDGKLCFGATKDMVSIDIIDKVSAFPNDPSIQPVFPTSGFSSVTNYNRGLHYNLLMVTAGENNDGEELNTTWLIRKTADGLELTPSSRNSYFKGAGISTFLYDNGLYAFAPLEREDAPTVDALYYSRSWGDRWAKAPDKQQPGEVIPKRTRPSIVADNENYIWIFGGVSKNGVALKDVWKGRLNRLAK
jgi:hypothetical protein